MNRAGSLFIALVCASLVPPVLYLAFSVWKVGSITKLDGIIEFLFGVMWLLSLAHIVVLGLPIFFGLARTNRLGWLSISALGFVVGALPFALVAHPTHQDSYFSAAIWHGKHVQMYVDGEPTIFAWLSHGEASLAAGYLGLAAAITFWRVHRLLTLRATNEPDA